jgi:hypothetical protein
MIADVDKLRPANGDVGADVDVVSDRLEGAEVE